MSKHLAAPSAFVFSLILHGLILLCGVLVFHFSVEQPIPSISKLSTISSYLYLDQKEKVYRKSKPIIIRKPNELLKQPVAKNHQLAIKQSGEKSNKPAKTVSSVKNNATIPIDELLAHLHRSIKAHQHYPAAAEQMEREGRVTIRFTLLQDGAIQGMQIVQSSGTASLDKAGLIAVSEAAPFKEIEHYLTAPQQFTVDVVFELAG